jgi:hypothetical protein
VSCTSAADELSAHPVSQLSTAREALAHLFILHHLRTRELFYRDPSTAFLTSKKFFPNCEHACIGACTGPRVTAMTSNEENGTLANL